MKSMPSVTLIAAVALLGATHAAAEPIPSPATLASRQNALTYEGCYSSSSGLSYNSSYTFNTKGYCHDQCVPAGYSVQATTNKTDCWCGNDLPSSSAKVDDSFCNDPCAGYGTEMCGSAGSKYFSVYLTGSGTVGNSDDTSKPSATSAGSTASSTTSAKPSVVTVGGQTIVVTATGSAGATSSSTSKSSGGPSKTGIAVGVVVGIVALSAIAGGVYLFMRNKRRREVEEEYKRNAAVSQFIAGGKAPSSSGGTSTFTDTRLDPVLAQRRMSDGSIADNQDYSRRILKVTNA